MRSSRRVSQTGQSRFAAIVLCVLCLAVGCAIEVEKEASFPEKPLKVIVPFGAGGGSDTFTRILQKAIANHGLLDQPLVVINMPGAGGSIGSRKVKNARPDGYTLLQIHEGMLTNKYSGNANFGPEAFSPIAGTGRMAHVIAVPHASPHQNLTDLLDAASESPDSIVFAVGIGAPSHFAGLMLENASASHAQFRFTQSGGGAKRLASLLGGHSSVSTFSVAEFVEFEGSGLRGLAILSDERHARVPNVPTAIEQGIPVESTNRHFWWAPKGTPTDRVATIGEALQAAMQLPEVQEALAELATEPEVIRASDLADELARRERQISSVTQRETVDIPNFGLVTLTLFAVLGFSVVLQHRLRPKLQSDAAGPDVNFRAQSFVVAAILSYVLVLQFLQLDYRIATAVFVCLVGCYMTKGRYRFWPVIGLVALSLALGLHFVFTRVLVIDLP